MGRPWTVRRGNRESEGEKGPPSKAKGPSSIVEHRSAPLSSASFGCKRVASGLQKALGDRLRTHKTPASTLKEGGSAYRIRTGVTAVRGQWRRRQAAPPSATKRHLTREKSALAATECHQVPASAATYGCRKVARLGFLQNRRGAYHAVIRIRGLRPWVPRPWRRRPGVAAGWPPAPPARARRALRAAPLSGPAAGCC